jgi:hypothetical protein
MRKTIAISLFILSAVVILFALTSTFAAITRPHSEFHYSGALTSYDVGYNAGYIIGRIAIPVLAVVFSIFLIRKGQTFLKDKVNLG